MRSDAWKECRLGDVLPLLYGKGLRASERVRSGSVPVYGSNGPFDTHDKALTSGPVVVIGRKGSIGQVHFVREPCWVGDTAFYISETDEIDMYFAYCLLSTLRLNEMNTDSAVPGLNRQNAQRLVVRLPPLEEQRAIAEVLGSVDERIESLRSVSRTAEALLIEAYRGLPLQKYTAVEVGLLVEICGGATPSTQDPSLWGGPHNWFTPRDLSNENSLVVSASARKISDAGLSKIASGLLPVGTVLMSSRAPIGYVAVLSNPAAINQGFIALPPSMGLSPAFLVAWIRTSLAMIIGRAGGSTFPEVSKRNFRSLLIPQPEGPEYEAFASVGASLLAVINHASKERERLGEVRDALLPKLVSGEIRIEDPERLLDRAA